jgi:hypothetical protein
MTIKKSYSSYAIIHGLLDSWMNGLADFRLKAWSIVAVGFTRVRAHGGRFPDYICPAGAIQEGKLTLTTKLTQKSNHSNTKSDHFFI